MDTRPLLGHLVKGYSRTRLVPSALIAFLTFYVTTGYDRLPSARTNTPEAIEYKPWQGALELSLPSTLYPEYQFVRSEAYVWLLAGWSLSIKGIAL